MRVKTHFQANAGGLDTNHMEAPAQRKGFHDGADILGRRPENVPAKTTHVWHIRKPPLHGRLDGRRCHNSFPCPS